MVGKIPGLVSLKTNQPLPICVPRAKGFDMGLVAVLESPAHVEGYAAHPAHLEYVLVVLPVIVILNWRGFGLIEWGWTRTRADMTQGSQAERRALRGYIGL